MTNAEIYRALGSEFARDYDVAGVGWRRSVEAAVGSKGNRQIAALVEALSQIQPQGTGVPKE